MYEYQTLPALTKLYQAREFPSPSKIFSALNVKQTAFFRKAIKDPNSALTKAVRSGTKIHKVLEDNKATSLFEQTVLDCFNEQIGVDIDEVWAKEKGLVSQSKRYKGKFDGVGIFRGKLTVWDYKKTNKLKTGSQIKNYVKQLGAYAHAHDEMYGSKVEQVCLFNIAGMTNEDVVSKVFTFDPQQPIEMFLDDLNKYQNIQQ